MIVFKKNVVQFCDVLEYTVVPHINKVWTESNEIFLEGTVALTMPIPSITITVLQNLAMCQPGVVCLLHGRAEGRHKH
jgi:hypothetical protein